MYIVETHLLAIFIVSLLLHGQILLGATVSMDGWILQSWRSRKNPELTQFYTVTGLPIIGWLHNRIQAGKFVRQKYGLIIFFSLYFGNCSVYFLISDLNFLSAGDKWVMLLLFMTYSGKQSSIDMVVGMQYIVTYSSYLISILVLKTAISRDDFSYYTLAVIAAFFLFVSFSAKSTLLLHVCVILSAFYFQNPTETNVKSNILLAINLVFPFAFWFFSEHFFPRFGPYKNYNQLLPLNFTSLRKIIFSLADAFREGVHNSITKPLKTIFESILFFPFAIFITLWLEDFLTSKKGVDSAEVFLLVSFIVSFIGWCLPYILARQEFDYRGYLSKNNLMADLSYTSLCSLIWIILDSPFNYFWAGMLILGSTLQIWKNYGYQIMDFLKNSNLQFVYLKQFGDYRGELVIIDNSHWKIRGKKAKLYPMTLFYMLNPNPIQPKVLPSNHYLSGESKKGEIHGLFDCLELPLDKSVISSIPKQIALIEVRDLCKPTVSGLYKTYFEFLVNEFKYMGQDLGIIEIRKVVKENTSIGIS